MGIFVVYVTKKSRGGLEKAWKLGRGHGFDCLFEILKAFEEFVLVLFEDSICCVVLIERLRRVSCIIKG